ncbi:hypothetical protein [Metabacillus halosaccharovorans]|uniref:hypothetical protein n=1 Tax=Metabacillus halosaccharovorans TaxID=930124 RepID=UPI0037362772
MIGFILWIIFITFLLIVGAIIISGRAKDNTKERKKHSTFIPSKFIGDSHDKDDRHDSSDDGGSGGD